MKVKPKKKKKAPKPISIPKQPAHVKSFEDLDDIIEDMSISDLDIHK